MLLGMLKVGGEVVDAGVLRSLDGGVEEAWHSLDFRKY
jgi:hypothetical protein